MERRFLAWVPAAAAFMAAILLLDRDGLAPQLALGMATAVFLAFFVRSLDLDPRPILWCVALSMPAVTKRSSSVRSSFSTPSAA